MNDRGKPWAGLVRVSHMGARREGDTDFHSDREQVDAMVERAQRIGVELHLLPPELDVSGGAPLAQRPSLLAAVEGVERGEYAGLMVAYISRLGRNTREQLAAWDRIEAAGGRIIAVAEDVDTTTASGRFLRTVLLANAQRELEEHTDRFDRLRDHSVRAGIWQRRQTPRGYAVHPITRSLVPDDQAAEVVEAFEWRAARRPLVEIARRLGMTPSGARHLLRNRVYLGELKVGPYVNASAHEPIVSPELFLAAQHTTGIRPARGRDLSGPALLAGLVRCCGCGHVMTRTSSGNRGERLRQYACPVNHSTGRCPAPASITLRRLDEHVEAIALSELSKLRGRATRRGDAVETARDRLQLAEAELAAYIEATSAVGLGVEAFAAGMRSRQAEVQAAQAALAGQLTREPAGVTGDPLEAWAAFDVTERNRLLRGLIECVLVERSGGRGRVRPVGDRVRVLAYGAGVAPGRYRGGAAMPVESIALPHLEHEHVLRVPSPE